MAPSARHADILDTAAITSLVFAAVALPCVTSLVSLVLKAAQRSQHVLQGDNSYIESWCTGSQDACLSIYKWAHAPPLKFVEQYSSVVCGSLSCVACCCRRGSVQLVLPDLPA